MNTPSFAQCLAHTGLTLEPGLEQFYLDYCRCPETGPVLNKSFLDDCAQRFGLGLPQLERMHQALEEVDADPILAFFTRFLVKDMCSARHRCDLDDYRAMAPAVCATGTSIPSCCCLAA